MIETVTGIRRQIMVILSSVTYDENLFSALRHATCWHGSGETNRFVFAIFHCYRGWSKIPNMEQIWFLLSGVPAVIRISGCISLLRGHGEVVISLIRQRPQTLWSSYQHTILNFLHDTW